MKGLPLVHQEYICTLQASIPPTEDSSVDVGQISTGEIVIEDRCNGRSVSLSSSLDG